jgi:hypothetical protein
MIGTSWRISWILTTSGAIRALSPRMNSTLKMLLPTTLPMARSVLAVEHGADTDRQLRRAGAEGHDGQSDDQRADAEGKRQLGRPADQGVGTGDKQDQPGGKCQEAHDG